MATTYRIQKFGVLNVAIFIAIIGFIWGLCTVIISLAGMAYTGQTSQLGQAMPAFGAMIAVGIIGGFVGGAIVTCVYNALLGKTRGIEMVLVTKG